MFNKKLLFAFVLSFMCSGVSAELDRVNLFDTVCLLEAFELTVPTINQHHHYLLYCLKALLIRHDSLDNPRNRGLQKNIKDYSRLYNLSVASPDLATKLNRVSRDLDEHFRSGPSSAD